MAIRKTMSKKQTEPKKTSPSASQKYPLKNAPNYVEKKQSGYKKPSYSPVRAAVGRIAKAAPATNRQDTRSAVQRGVEAAGEGISQGFNKIKRELGISSKPPKKNDTKQSAKNAAMKGGYYKSGKK